MSKMEEIKGFIFDLDGTLLDTIEDIKDSMNLVLERRGFPVHDTAFYKDAVGEGTEKLVIASLLENQRDEKTVKECLYELKENYSKMWANKTKPYEGIEELLSELFKRGKSISILSNKDDRFTKEMVSYYFPNFKFDFVFGSRDGIPKKPSPQVALYISEKTGIPPHNYAFIGDSGFDIQTGKNAGMFSVGVSWGFKTIESLIENGADLIVEKPHQILTLIK